jgi:hypothetical protein
MVRLYNRPIGPVARLLILALRAEVEKLVAAPVLVS